MKSRQRAELGAISDADSRPGREPRSGFQNAKCCFYRIIRAAGLLFDFDAAPEGDVSLDVACCRLGIGVIPRRILILLLIDQQVVIPGLALPWAGGCG